MRADDSEARPSSPKWLRPTSVTSQRTAEAAPDATPGEPAAPPAIEAPSREPAASEMVPHTGKVHVDTEELVLNCTPLGLVEELRKIHHVDATDARALAAAMRRPCTP